MHRQANEVSQSFLVKANSKDRLHLEFLCPLHAPHAHGVHPAVLFKELLQLPLDFRLLFPETFLFPIVSIDQFATTPNDALVTRTLRARLTHRVHAALELSLRLTHFCASTHIDAGFIDLELRAGAQ